MKKGLYLFACASSLFSLVACSSLGGLRVVGEKDRIYSNVLSEYYLIGEAYLENKKYQKAIEYYTKALEHPDLTDSARYKIAYAYALAENWEKSRAGYEELLEKDPDNSDLTKSLAYIYARQGDLAHASALYRTLVEKNPYDQSIQENFITVLIAGNYLEEAEIVLQKHLCFLNMFLRDGLQHLQIPAGITAQNAQGSRHINALHSAGIGHRHTHHILDDIAAAADMAALGHGAQDLTAFGRGISNGNGFRAAHGCHQFFFQNAAVCRLCGGIHK